MRGECHCCGYETALEEYPHHKTETVHLCVVCANTRLSNAVFFPEQCPDVSLYRSLAWVTNYLADLIADLIAGKTSR